MHIRKIKPSDNPFLKKIIQSSLIEFNLPMTGTAYEDADTQNMYNAYQGHNEVYFVLEDQGKVMGGGGIKALKASKGTICELQKMYFAPKARGKGFGTKLFKKCINAARTFGYKKCYLESDPALKTAIAMYKKHGFTLLKKPLGNTGHNACDIWMIKDLNSNID